MTTNNEAFEKWLDNTVLVGNPDTVAEWAWQAAKSNYEETWLIENEKKILALESNNHDLREVLENVLPWVVYQPVACHGMKCRESVCESCCGEEAAEIASKQAGEAVTIARKTLSATPSQSLQSHYNELLERAASIVQNKIGSTDETPLSDAVTEILALKEASAEFKGLPHSLGYDITHCKKYDALIKQIEATE